jgi:hypothetical protein
MGAPLSGGKAKVRAEPMTGIEPAYSAWETMSTLDVRSYTRERSITAERRGAELEARMRRSRRSQVPHGQRPELFLNHCNGSAAANRRICIEAWIKNCSTPVAMLRRPRQPDIRHMTG